MAGPVCSLACNLIVAAITMDPAGVTQAFIQFPQDLALHAAQRAVEHVIVGNGTDAV